MRKIVRKFIPIWKVEEEEKWLNDMADAGWKLVSVAFGRFEFESCQPGAYHIRMELLENWHSHPDSVKYLSFMEETGAQVVARWMRWVYFARPREEGEFELYSDRPSRLKYMKRMMQLVAAVTAGNVYVGLYNVWLLCRWGVPVNALGFVNLLIGGLGAAGFWKMYQGYRKLRDESAIFE